jgi:hypothetical protein
VVKKRVVGTDLFPGTGTFGNREAMFFAKDNKFIELDGKKAKEAAKDESLEMALFRSASWPYLGTPRDVVAKHAGHYRVRFSARAVLQQPGYTLAAGEATGADDLPHAQTRRCGHHQ